MDNNRDKSGLLRELGRMPRQLWTLWLAQFIAKAGDQLFVTSGMFLVLRLSDPLHSKYNSGLTELSRAIPALLFGLIAGALVDRIDRRRLMVGSDLLRCAIAALLPAAYLLGVLEWWMIPAASFLIATAATVFEPARDSLLPSIVAREQLHRANALFQTSMPLASIVGSTVLGLVAGFRPPGEASKLVDVPILVGFIGLDSLAFLVSAILITAIRLPGGATLPPSVGPHRPDVPTQIREMLKLSVSDRRLGLLLLITAVNNLFLMGPATVGAVILFDSELQRSFGQFALFNGFMTIGMLCGLFWVMKWGVKLPRGKVLLTGLILDGATYLPFLWVTDATPLWLLYSLICFHGFFIPWIVVSRTLLVQTVWPAAMHGRIFAAIAMTVTGFHSISAFLTAWLIGGTSGPQWPPQLLFALGGGLAALVGVMGLFVRPVARLR